MGYDFILSVQPSIYTRRSNFGAIMFGSRWAAVDSHWQHLKVLFNPIVTRLFIAWFAIAPIVLRLTERLPETIQVTKDIQLKLGLPFNWAVLWWASLAYAVAFVIYTAFCPKFIKDYPDFDSYSDRGHSPRWLVWEYYLAWNAISHDQKKKLLKRTFDKKFVVEESAATNTTDEPTVLKEGTTFIFALDEKKYKLQIDEHLEQARVKDMFWEIFGRWSQSAPKRRMAAWLLFYGALALTAFVVAENIWFVLTRLLHVT